MNLDKVDISILEALQKDGRLSNRDLAKKVSLSPSPSWRRLRALEEAGVISRYAAVVDRHQVGLSIMGFAHVTLHDHSTDKVRKFDEAIMRAPQVLECHATSGGHDYMLKVVAPDMASYQDFLSEYLLKMGVVRTVNTSFALKQQKNTTILPLDQVKLEKA
ncbi:Lrp/AsnC family transcriptional regulator [Pseudomonadota bacterium]